MYTADAKLFMFHYIYVSCISERIVISMEQTICGKNKGL